MSKTKKEKTTLRVPEKLLKALDKPLVPEGGESRVERLTTLVDGLKLEKALYYPTATLEHFLVDIKGFSKREYLQIVKHSRAEDWREARAKVHEQLFTVVADKHAQLIAEAQENYIKASNLVMAKGIEFMAKHGISPEDLYVIRESPDGKRKESKKRTLRSVDILNVSSAIKNAYDIYRKAVGLPDDEGSTQQLISAIKTAGAMQFVQNNVTVNMDSSVKPKTEAEKKLAEMDYEDIFALIKLKRSVARGEVIDVTPVKKDEKK